VWSCGRAAARLRLSPMTMTRLKTQIHFTYRSRTILNQSQFRCQKTTVGAWVFGDGGPAWAAPHGGSQGHMRGRAEVLDVRTHHLLYDCGELAQRLRLPCTLRRCWEPPEPPPPPQAPSPSLSHAPAPRAAASVRPHRGDLTGEVEKCNLTWRF
jgi:hypothetical protein